MTFAGTWWLRHPRQRSNLSPALNSQRRCLALTPWTTRFQACIETLNPLSPTVTWPICRHAYLAYRVSFESTSGSHFQSHLSPSTCWGPAVYSVSNLPLTCMSLQRLTSVIHAMCSNGSALLGLITVRASAA